MTKLCTGRQMPALQVKRLSGAFNRSHDTGMAMISTDLWRTSVNTNLLAFGSGVDQGLRRSLAKTILVVAGELAEVGVTRCDRCLCDAVWPFPASFDESITREIETHRLQVTHRRCRSKAPEALIDRSSTYAADRHEVVCTNLVSCVFSKCNSQHDAHNRAPPNKAIQPRRPTYSCWGQRSTTGGRAFAPQADPRDRRNRVVSR